MAVIYVPDDLKPRLQELQERTGLKTGPFFERVCDAFVRVYGDTLDIESQGNGANGDGGNQAGRPNEAKADESAQT